MPDFIVLVEKDGTSTGNQSRILQYNVKGAQRGSSTKGLNFRRRDEISDEGMKSPRKGWSPDRPQLDPQISSSLRRTTEHRLAISRAPTQRKRFLVSISLCSKRVLDEGTEFLDEEMKSSAKGRGRASSPGRTQLDLQISSCLR